MSLTVPYIAPLARSIGPALASAGRRKLATSAVPLDEPFPGVTIRPPPGPLQPASVQDVSDLAVVGQETHAPVATMCLLIGAGSRDETSGNTGVAAIARRLAFKTSALHSQLATVREFERLGSELTATSYRETTMICVQASRDIVRMVGLLAEELGGRLRPSTWEVDQCRKELAYEAAAMASDPTYVAIEGLHQAAFRGPLSQCVLPASHHVNAVHYDDVLAFLEAHYTKANAVLAATGVPEEFFQFAREAFSDLPKGTRIKRQPAKYKGGLEVRIDAGSPTTTVALGFQAPAMGSRERLAAAVLQHALGTGPLTKWGSLSGRLGASVQKVIKNPAQVSAFNLSYSDTGLLGVLAVAGTDDMGCVMGVVKDTLADVAAKGLTDDEVGRAKAQVKTAMLLGSEMAGGKVEDMACQIFFTGKFSGPETVAQQVDLVTTADVNKVAKWAFGSKASMTTVGKIANAPFLDQVTF